MQKIWGHFIKHIQCPLCLRCGSFVIEKNYFCKTCTKIFLYPKFAHIERSLSLPLQVYSFINWQNTTQQSLAQLVYLLKTKNSRRAWQWFVERLEPLLCDIIVADENAVLIVIPGSKTSYHTDYFSEELQKLTGLRLMRPFETSQLQGNQKSKSAIRRKDIHFKFREEFTDELRGVTRIYLIDDIITTGSTLLGAAEAIAKRLSRPNDVLPHIIGVTLFNRPLQLKI